MTLDPFDLNIRHLRAVHEIAETGSLSAAAQAVGLSQPALTQGLGKLERQLGAPLFERHASGMRPTAEGASFAERCGLAFAHLAQVMRRSGRGFSRPEQLVTGTQLKAFLLLAGAGSFVAAAGASRLSQPSIHRAVRDLEQVCGVVLAERRGRFVALTAAGRRVARGVRLAAAEISAGMLAMSAEQEDRGRIAIGAMPLSRAVLLPRAIAAFLAGRPRAQVDVVEGSWRELVEPLRDGIIDLMIGALREDQPEGLEQRALFEDRLIVVARAGHPLAARRVDVTALASCEWVVGSAGTPIRARWEALFAGRDLPLAPVECGSVMVIRGLLADSDLLSLVSPEQVALELASGMLVTIDGPSPAANRMIGIIMRAGWRPTAAQARLVELLDEARQPPTVQESE